MILGNSFFCSFLKKHIFILATFANYRNQSNKNYFGYPDNNVEGRDGP